jgi:hypothetical protein
MDLQLGLMTCIRIGKVTPMHWYIEAKLSVAVQTMPQPTLKIKLFCNVVLVLFP